MRARWIQHCFNDGDQSVQRKNELQNVQNVKEWLRECVDHLKENKCAKNICVKHNIIRIYYYEREGLVSWAKQPKR